MSMVFSYLKTAKTKDLQNMYMISFMIGLTMLQKILDEYKGS